VWPRGHRGKSPWIVDGRGSAVPPCMATPNAQQHQTPERYTVHGCTVCGGRFTLYFIHRRTPTSKNGDDYCTATATAVVVQPPQPVESRTSLRGCPSTSTLGARSPTPLLQLQ